jgi:hypothetical protein
MATNTVTPVTSLGLRAGANELQALLRHMQEVGYASLDNSGDEDLEEDTRDYRAMSKLVVACIERNQNHVDPARREGFLRALTALLSCVADCSTPGPNWDPIRITAPSYASEERCT